MATYTLTVNPDQGYWKQTNNWNIQTRTISVDEGASIPIVDPVRKGYKFLSWNLNNDTCYIYNRQYFQGTGDCTIIAVWAPDPTKDNWNTEISKVFREPGDFRYQLVSGMLPEISTIPDDIESQWLLFSSAVPLSESIFKKTYISTVGNGSWILDGSLASVCENNIFNNNISEVARRYTLPAEWIIDITDANWWEISSVPNDSGVISIVWDSNFQGYPTTFTIQGITYLSETEIETVWTLDIADNSDVISIVDVSSFKNLTYSSLRIVAQDWNRIEYTPPTLTALYFGYTEDSETSTKGILSVKHLTSINLYSNELSTQDISIENSNLSYYRDVNRDLLLESSLPGNSRIFAQYGLTYPNGSIYYSDVLVFATSKYSAPTDTQTITIEGTDLLATGTEVFQFNYIYRTSTSTTLEDIVSKTFLNTILQIDTYNWPSEIRDEALSTYSMGALPKDTTVNQVYQYVAQILEAIVYTDMTSGAIKAKKVTDLLTPVSYELNQDITTSWPAITLNTQINRIDIKKYKVCNTHEDLYKVIYSTQVTVPKNSKDPSGKWYSKYITLLYEQTPLDYEGPKEMRVTKSDKNDSTPFSYTVGYIGTTSAYLNITYQSTEKEGQFNIEVLGYPGYPVFDTQSISGSAGEIITITKSWDNAKRNVGIYKQDDKFTIISNNAGAYYCKVEVQLLKDISASNPVVIKFFGADVEITSEVITYWDNTSNASGEILTIDNPLISTDYTLNKVGAFIKGLILNRKHYKIDYLGDPSLNAMDTRKVITDYETLNDFIVTKSELNFNGGYSGTIEGRIL